MLLILNLLDKSAVCTAVGLFELACLIRHDGNTKGKRNNFTEHKLNIPWNTDEHMKANTSSAKLW
jgi:hypothetical protein